MKKLLYSLAIIIFSVFIFNACGEDDNDVSPTCDSCSSSSPWSKPGITNCYATKAACESAEGGTCEICN